MTVQVRNGSFGTRDSSHASGWNGWIFTWSVTCPRSLSALDYPSSPHPLSSPSPACTTPHLTCSTARPGHF